MTTYTIDAVELQFFWSSDILLDAGPADVSLVMAPGQGGFTYQHGAAAPSVDFNYAEVTSPGIYSLVLDGKPFDPDDAAMIIHEIDWGGGKATPLASLGAEPSHVYFVRLGGDPLPRIDSLSDFQALDRITSGVANISAGPFAPGMPIRLGDLPGVTVTEHDTITGGDGNDSFAGGIGRDRIFGRLGADLLSGGVQADTLDGGEGNDTLIGGFGRDKAFMGAGDDLFRDNGQGGDLGRDTVTGGTGNDTIQGGNGNDDFRGGTGHDLIFGRKGSDRLEGSRGADTLDGGDGNDTLTGGVGDDLLRSGRGDDTLDGGDGNDRLNGGRGRDLVFMGAGDDLYIDNAQGGDLGRDTVYGGAGNDTVQGGNGNDTFRGEAGNDRLFGRLGDDLIAGGAGRDTLTGGDGADTFVFSDGDGADRVTDFTTGTDVLRLDAGLWAGTLSAAQVVMQFASVQGGKVVFDFGGGDTLTLEGLSATAGLEGDLVLV
ncbi:MAG: calcium-binding protein [Paracoccaceae bacterium]